MKSLFTAVYLFTYRWYNGHRKRERDIVMLKICNLNKRFFTSDGEIVALNNVSLQVERGEYIAIVGRSGSGKTTLLNMIGGLDIPDSGSILFDGKDIAKLSGRSAAILRRQKIGVIYQFYI